MQWSDGYTVDVPFPDQVVRPALPPWLSLVSVLHGFPPLPADRPIRYLELACGTGRTSLTVGATWPNAEVWACDVNPMHVEEARRLARAAELDNVRFEEASFADVVERSLGPTEVDVIVIMGIFSWLTEDNQALLFDIIRERLAPGGIVCVGYSVAATSASFVPKREVLRLFAEAHQPGGAACVPEAIDFLERSLAVLPHAGASDSNDELIASLRKMSPAYIAHDYFTSDYRPSSFADVFDAMAGARCSYVGAADPTGHVWALATGPGMAEMVAGTADVRLRETLRDLGLTRSGRTDLFRRGLAFSPVQQQLAWAESMQFVGLDREFDVEQKVRVIVGEVTLSEQFHLPVIDLLRKGPISVRDVRALPAFADLPFEEAMASLALLVSSGHAAPLVPAWQESDTGERARRMNMALIADNRRGYAHPFLVAPALGTEIAVEFVESLTIGHVFDGAEHSVSVLTELVMGDLIAQQRHVIEDGTEIVDDGAAREVVERRVERALGRVEGVLTRLGVC
jgi:SAM-dependent methyltransferase